MSTRLRTDIDDFSRRDLEFNQKTKPVLTLGGSGPAVIVIHEVYGFTPEVARFCRWLADAGLRVYAPILLGQPNAQNAAKITLGKIVGLCVSREFHLFKTGASSPIVDWLRPLAALAHEECGGRGVGVIGMCLTGGFALSMAVDPVVLAPVLSQPSMPPGKHDQIDISPSDLAKVQARVREEGLKVLGYRFDGDDLCRPAKFEALGSALGKGFVGTYFPDSVANPEGRKPPHSVFTGDLIDAAGQPTRKAVDEVIAHFKAVL
jgi:dienelactone hydrolase